MIRAVQLIHPQRGRAVALVDEPHLRLVTGAASLYQLAQDAIASKVKLAKLIASRCGGETLDYDAIYRAESEWSLLPPFDHPAESARCFITGTGLTHKASAENRQSMHVPQEPGLPAPALNDSMRMYQIGLDGGRPAAGRIGASPEWFYKGTGSIVQPHGVPLAVPSHADDGGEEAEIAGCYLIDDT